MSGTAQGALWIVGGMAVIAVSDNFIPAVAERMSLWQFHILRSAMVLALGLALTLALGRGALWIPQDARRVAERSALSVLALMLYFAALPAVGIAQAAAGLFTSPLWLVGIALASGEGAGPRRIAAVAIGFLGTCLVLGIGAQPFRPMAAVAVAGGAAYALGVVWTRRHCRTERAATLALWQFGTFLIAGALGAALAPLAAPWLAAVEGTAFATRPWMMPEAPLLLTVLGIGIAGAIATACLAIGYQRGESALMGLFDFSFLLWGPLFAYLLWGERLGPETALGMALIVGAGGLALWSSGGRGRRLRAGR